AAVERADGRAIEEDAAGVGLQQAGEDLEEGALAGAVRAEEAEELALAERERDPFEHAPGTERAGERFDTEQAAVRGGGRCRGGGGSRHSGPLVPGAAPGRETARRLDAELPVYEQRHEEQQQVEDRNPEHLPRPANARAG